MNLGREHLVLKPFPPHASTLTFGDLSSAEVASSLSYENKHNVLSLNTHMTSFPSDVGVNKTSLMGRGRWSEKAHIGGGTMVVLNGVMRAFAASEQTRELKSDDVISLCHVQQCLKLTTIHNSNFRQVLFGSDVTSVNTERPRVA